MVPFDGPPGPSAPAGMAPQYTVVNQKRGYFKFKLEAVLTF